MNNRSIHTVYGYQRDVENKLVKRGSANRKSWLSRENYMKIEILCSYKTVISRKKNFFCVFSLFCIRGYADT